MSTTVLSIYAMHRSLSLKNTYQRGCTQRLRISSGKQCTAMYDWQDIGIQQYFTDLVHGPSIKPYRCWQQRTVAHGSFHHCFSGFVQDTVFILIIFVEFCHFNGEFLFHPRVKHRLQLPSLTFRRAIGFVHYLHGAFQSQLLCDGIHFQGWYTGLKFTFWFSNFTFV